MHAYKYYVLDLVFGDRDRVIETDRCREKTDTHRKR